MKIDHFKIKSHISHDAESNRIYLMSLHPDDFPDIINYLDHLARENTYTKLFAKVPATYSPAFLEAGYGIEAFVPCFFDGEEDALFLTKYLSDERRLPEEDALENFQKLLLQSPVKKNTHLASNFLLKPLGTADALTMVAVFEQVFDSYPFPIFDPAFLVKSMQEDGTRYFGIYDNEQLVAVSSAECCDEHKNAEMTDFAVLPAYRGKGFASVLLSFMEQELTNDGFQTFYTIARLHSIAMNKTFYDAGYKYTGTLTRNTQISGRIESMNVWYKRNFL